MITTQIILIRHNSKFTEILEEFILRIVSLATRILQNLDEISACHHADERCFMHIGQCTQFPSGQNGLQMSFATCLAHCFHL
jgi:hypothetical protein